MPKYVWPLIGLGVLIVAWVGYLSVRVFADLGDPPSGQLLAVRLVGLGLVLTFVLLLVRARLRRRTGS